MFLMAGSRAAHPRSVLTLGRFKMTGPSLRINDIPQNGSMLWIYGIGRCTTAGTGTSGIILRFNGDTGANYMYQDDDSSGSSSFGSRATGQTGIRIAQLPTAGDVATYGAVFSCLVPFYANKLLGKGIISEQNLWDGAAVTNNYTIQTTGAWNNAAPIKQLDIVLSSGSWVYGSELAVQAI